MTQLNFSERTDLNSNTVSDYEHIFRYAKACMVTFDPVTTLITDANEAACRLYGYSLRELTQKRILDLTTSKPERTRELIDQVLQSKEDVIGTCHRDKSGCLHYLEFHASVFMSGNKPYIFSIIHDITEKTIAERERQQALEYSENKYRTYVNNAPISIFITSHTGNIIEINKEACRITGYSEDELLSMTVMDLWAPDSVENARKAEEALFEQGIMSETLKFIRKNGESFFMSVSVIKIARDRFIGFCQDATATAQLESELKIMNESLKEQVKIEVEARRKQEQIIHEQKKLADMGQMINAIAHQWRQPINALGLYVQDAHECWKRGLMNNTYMDLFSETSMGIIKHISSTIDDFRLFFAPDKKKVRYNVIREISELAGLIEVQLAAKNIDIRINSNAEDEIQVYGYAGEFRQALINIIYNAADAIESAPDKRHGEISINIGTEGYSVVITVTDNGTGIPDGHLLKIFEPYFTTKEEGKGTGIGLYMTKLLIEKHMGGRITASNSEKGACFAIILPKGGNCDEE